MGLFSRLFSRRSAPQPANLRALATLELPLPDWDEEPQNDVLSRVWRRSDGSVLTASLTSSAIPDQSIDAFRASAREIAQAQSAGLVEALFVETPSGTGAKLIYKKGRGMGFVFSGMLFVPLDEGSLVWMAIAGESGTTGLRKAGVTTDLVNAGALTLDAYETSWACDPYDPSYKGVDRRCLRYESDDEQYDARFPFHPLTQVRGMLTDLARLSVAPGGIQP